VAGAAAVPVVELEAGPRLRYAGVDAQRVALLAEAKDGLQPRAVQPRRRTGVPGPAAAAGQRAHRVHVGAGDVGLDLVARRRVGIVAVTDRVEEPEQFARAVAVAQRGPGEDRPHRAVRVLAAVLAHAGRIALDVAGVLLVVLVERRREQAREPMFAIHQLALVRGHRLRRVRGIGGAGQHAPRLRDGVDAAGVAGVRAKRCAVVVIAAAIPGTIPGLFQRRSHGRGVVAPGPRADDLAAVFGQGGIGFDAAYQEPAHPAAFAAAT